MKDPNLVVNGKFQCLVALGRFYCLVALGRFHCLVANGREGDGHFHLFPLSPQQILFKPSFFSTDNKVLFYHGFRPSLTHFLPFP